MSDQPHSRPASPGDPVRGPVVKPPIGPDAGRRPAANPYPVLPPALALAHGVRMIDPLTSRPGSGGALQPTLYISDSLLVTETIGGEGRALNLIKEVAGSQGIEVGFEELGAGELLASESRESRLVAPTTVSRVRLRSDAAPPDASPLEVVASAMRGAGSFFPDERRPYSRLRQSVIDQNPALRERELHKFAGLATTVAEALRARGIGEPAATLAAESGATVFGIAFAQWIREGETRSLPDITSDVLRELLNLTGAATGPPNLRSRAPQTSRPQVLRTGPPKT